MSNPLLNIIVLVVSGALAFGLSLFTRKHVNLDGLHPGSWASTMTYVATAYGVLIGFSILLLFGQFTDARQAVGDEATSIGTAFEEAALFPKSAHRIQQALVCYAESASADDWPAMRRGGSSAEVDLAFAKLVQSLGHNDQPPAGALHAATATNLVSQLGDISTAREIRLVAAETGIPPMMWVLLIGGGVFVIVLIFMITLPSRPRTQAVLVTSTAVFTIVMLLLVDALSKPFVDGPGRVDPRLIDEAVATMRASPNATSLAPCEPVSN